MLTDARPALQSTTTNIEKTISDEVLRKLSLALSVHTAADRHIICAEVFNDVTGDVDDSARDALKIRDAVSFYEVLAPYYQKNTEQAEKILELCQKLWSHRLIAAVYSLLLHLWLLQGSGATGHRASKLLVVLLSGCKQLFKLDTTNGTIRFQGLHSNILNSMQTAGQPETAVLDPLLSITAGYVAYYQPPQSVFPILFDLPALSSHSDNGEGLHDYIVKEIARLMHDISSVKGLLRYLKGVEPLLKRSNEWKEHVSMVPLLQLQGELYTLTLPGGPRYCPSQVRSQAMKLLSDAFPVGSGSRSLVRLFFRLMHPSDWPALIWAWLVDVAGRIWGAIMLLVAAWYRCLGRRGDEYAW